MIENKEKLNILKDLYEGGFLHEEDYLKKVQVYINELSEEDKIKISQRNKSLQDTFETSEFNKMMLHEEILIFSNVNQISII